MKRAFSTLCCLEYSIPEILSLAAHSNMDAVELRVDDKMLASVSDADGYRKLFESKGIAVCDIASSIFVRDDTVSLLAEDYISLAESLSSPAVRVFASSDQHGVLDVSRIAEGLRKLCIAAEKHGVQIWLETHSEFSTGKSCRELSDAVNKANLKILWDVMHSIEHGESLEETFSLIGDRTVHIHLKDGRPAEDKADYTLCALGEGTFPFKEVIALLKRNKFDGCLSLEWESPWCPHLKEIYKDERELLEKYNEILTKAGFES